MKKIIYPKEIIHFSQENHYFKFSKHSKLIYLTLIALVFSCIASAPYIMFEISIQARGIIRSQAESTEVKTSVTAQVKKILIHENMKVHSGDTLMLLSNEKINDQLKLLSQKINLHTSYINDLKSIIDNHPQELKSDLIKSSYSEYIEKLDGYTIQLETTKNDYKRAKSLYEKNVIPLAEFEKNEFKLKQSMKELESYRSMKKAEWHHQLFQYNTELQNINNEFDRLSFEKRFYFVLAPANGYISNYSGVQAGSFIFPNQTIARIVPSDSLIVECLVTADDIGYLQKGQRSSFQVDAYNYNQWGLATGAIIDISNQPYQENESIFFKVRCRLDQEHLFLKSGYKGILKNGLTLTSRFMVTKRSVSELLFDKADNWLNPKILASKD